MTDLLRRQYDEMVSENARLQALLAERDAEIARLKLTTRSDREYAEQKQRAEEAEGEIARLVELGERMRLSAMYYAANYAANGGDVLCIEFHAACEAWRAALAARGGAS